jgi:hypothetical protein
MACYGFTRGVLVAFADGFDAEILKVNSIVDCNCDVNTTYLVNYCGNTSPERLKC